MLFSTSFVDVMVSFSVNGNESTFGMEVNDVLIYRFSGNWPETTSYDNITFIVTDVSTSTVSANAHLHLKNGDSLEKVIQWSTNSSFLYQWWTYFQIFIPLGLNVGDKTGSVVEYSEQYVSFDLLINGTGYSEWFDCTRKVMYVQRRWSFQDWVHTIIGEYDESSGIAYGLFESLQLSDTLYTMYLTLIDTTINLSTLPISISDVRYSPQKPTPDDQVSVTVDVEHPCYGVKAIRLFYSTDSGVSWTSKSIERSIIYTTKIPEQPEGTTVLFKIQVEDNAENFDETGVISYVVQLAEQTSGIPGFPVEGIVMGIIITTVIAYLLRKRRKPVVSSVPNI